MRPLSIRWRLTLWYAASLALILSGFCIALLLLTRSLLLARTDADLHEELQELALEVRLAKSEGDFGQQVRARFFQHDVYEFIVSDDRGVLLFASSGLTSAEAAELIRPPGNEGTQFSSRKVIDNQPWRVASATVDGSRGRVVVQALTPLRPMQQDLGALQFMMLVLLPPGLALALGGGYLLASRALAPVEQIVQVANAITISDLDRRIEVPDRHDELGRLASTLNSLIDRLQRAVAEIQRFTADASHELRTPLAILRSAAESCLRKRRTSEEYEQTLTVVVEEATRLGRLADQLLSLSRHDAGITECRRELVPVDALLLDVLESLRPLAGARGVTLAASVVEPCDVMGDDVRLSQAFSNVVENAVKFTPSGGLVTVECRVRDGSAVVRVVDSGAGIPGEHLAHVFERFYRVNSSRHSTTGGAGLGLAIARAAIEVHCGTIEIESEPGRGTTVTIRLPMSSCRRDKDPGAPRARREETAHPPVSVISH